MSKNQFTGTATQPQGNRKLCQFNKDQYCTTDIKLKKNQSNDYGNVTCNYIKTKYKIHTISKPDHFLSFYQHRINSPRL